MELHVNWNRLKKRCYMSLIESHWKNRWIGRSCLQSHRGSRACHHRPCRSAGVLGSRDDNGIHQFSCWYGRRWHRWLRGGLMPESMTAPANTMPIVEDRVFSIAHLLYSTWLGDELHCFHAENNNKSPAMITRIFTVQLEWEIIFMTRDNTFKTITVTPTIF